MDSGKRKWIAIALVVVLVVAALAAIIALSGNNAPKTSSVTDASGTTVSLDKVPNRIVSGAPEISEIVAALNLTDKLVAVTDYDDYPAGVATLASNGSTIGGFYTPSYEKTIAYNPDLVILSQGVSAHQQLATQLRAAGYNVLMVYAASDLGTVYKNIDMIGNVTATQAKASSLVSAIKAQVSGISDAVAGKSKPNVMFITYAEEGFTNVWPAGGATAIDEIINLSGGSNVFADMNGFQMASDEVLKAKASSVDCIVMTIMYSTESPENKSNWFNTDPIWKESPAVKNNKVYYLTGQAENIFNRESVRTVDAVQLLAEMLHPDAFTSKVPYNTTGVNIIGNEYVSYLHSGTASQAPAATMMAAVARD